MGLFIRFYWRREAKSTLEAVRNLSEGAAYVIG